MFNVVSDNTVLELQSSNFQVSALLQIRTKIKKKRSPKVTPEKNTILVRLIKIISVKEIQVVIKRLPTKKTGPEDFYHSTKN
jgi:hypothetical protein